MLACRALIIIMMIIIIILYIIYIYYYIIYILYYIYIYIEREREMDSAIRCSEAWPAQPGSNPKIQRNNGQIELSRHSNICII